MDSQMIIPRARNIKEFMMKATIAGTGSYLPSRVVDNEDMGKLVDTTDEWITSRTGINQRRYSEGESTWFMAEKAGIAALEDAGIDANDLDLIIVSSVTPDYYTPSLSCILQGRLAARKAAAFDINAACSGFVYGLDMADKYIASGKVSNILLVCSETLTKITDFTDRNTCVLFGDGAGAVVITATAEEGILGTCIAADGRGASMLTSKALQVENPYCLKAGPDILDSRQDRFIAMDGKEVYKFAVKAMPDAIDKVLASCGRDIAEVDHIIPHQANARIIESVIDKYGLDPAKVLITLDRYGNTSSASIPIGLDELNREGRIKKGDMVLTVGFGAGLTYGSALIKW